MMNKFAVTLAAALLASPAVAQLTPSQITPGMQVYYGNNQAVGVVTKVKDGMAYVSTGNHAVPVNPGSFALDRGKLYVSMDRNALDTYYVSKVLPAENSLVVGKPVVGLEGSTLGTIKEIDDTKVVITTTGGQPIQLPRSGIVGAATGAKVGISAADLAKQLGAAAPAPEADAAADATVEAGTEAK